MERIARDIRRRIRREETLQGMLRSLVAAGPLEDRLTGALAGLIQLLPFDVFELGHPDPAGGPGWILLQVDREALASGSGWSRRTVDHPGNTEGPASRALLLRGPISVDRYGSGRAGRLPDGFDASLTVPLFCGSEIIGLMAVYARRSGSFAHGDVAQLQQFGDLVTLVLDQQQASENLDHGGEAAQRLGRRLPSVSPCSRSGRYLADLGHVLEEVFSLRNCRLFEVRRESGSLELVEQFPGTVEGGPALEEGRHVEMSEFLTTLLASGEIQVAGKDGDTAPLVRLVSQQASPAELVVIPLRVEGNSSWVVSAEGDLALLAEPATGSLLRILQNLVEQALSGMAVYRDLRADLARLTGLLSLAKILPELTPESGVFQVVIDKLGELLDFDGCTLYLLEAEGRNLVAMVSNEAEEPSGDADSECWARRRQWLEGVLEAGEARMLNGYQEHQVPDERLMASPMLHQGRPFGIFCIRRAGRRRFNSDDLILLTTLAGLTADAMNRSLHQQKQEQLHRAFGLVDQHVGEGVLFLDARLRVTRASREALRLLGCSAGDLMGRSLHDHLFRSWKEAEGLVKDLTAGKRVDGFRTFARPTSETPVPVSVRAVLQDEALGVEGGFLVVFRDSSRQLRLERELGDAAVTDPLTGLRHRNEAYPALVAELDRGVRSDRFLSALFFRVRGMDNYSSRHGWMEGDRMIKRVGGIVGKRIRGPRRDAEAASRRILEGINGDFRGRVKLDAAVTQSRFADTADSLLQRLHARIEGTESPLPEAE